MCGQLPNRWAARRARTGCGDAVFGMGLLCAVLFGVNMEFNPSAMGDVSYVCRRAWEFAAVLRLRDVVSGLALGVLLFAHVLACAWGSAASGAFPAELRRPASARRIVTSPSFQPIA